MGRLRIVFKASMGMAVAMAILGMVEIALRIMLGPPPPSVQVFSGLEPKDHYFEVEDETVEASFQMSGVRPGATSMRGQKFRGKSDQATSFSQHTEEPRVVVLGGSVVRMGSNLALGEEFPAMLGRAVEVETLNLAAPALDSHDLVAMLEELESVDFSLLVVYTGHNDFGNTYFQARFGSMWGGLGARFRAGLERFQIFSRTQRLLGGLEGTASGTTTGDDGFELMNSDRMWTTLRYYEANLRRIAWLCEQRGTDLVLVVPASSLLDAPLELSCSSQPCAVEQWTQGTQMIYWDADGALQTLTRARDLDRIPLRAPSMAMNAVRRVAEEVGATLVDPTSQLPRDRFLDIPHRKYFKDVVHFTAEGHQAMSDLLVPVVEEHLQR